MNLSIRLSELTRTRVSFDAAREPRHFVVQLTDPSLFRCPFVMMTEPGGLVLDESEVLPLRDYLQKGGFLWADDFWGTAAWESFEYADAARPAGRPVSDARSRPRAPDLPHAVPGR